MVQEDEWSSFEENENSWFSLWTEARDIGYALLLLNENLADDPVFNHTTRVTCKPKEVDRLLDRVTSQYREKGIPPCFYVSPLTSPKDLGERLKDRGFKEWDQMDVLKYVGEGSSLYEGDIITVRKIGLESVKDWVRVFAESFEIPQAQTQEYLKRSRDLSPRPDVDFFLAYVGGKAVGCAILYSKNGVGGVYSLGTITEFRRRGLASSLLKAAINRSEERRNSTVILQALRRTSLEDFYNKNRFHKIYTKSIYILK